MMSDNIILNL